MPDSQGAQFNELIEMMNGVNERLGPYILILRANVEQLGSISGWLATIELWGRHVAELWLYIFDHVPEPITESDYRRLQKRRRDPRPEWGLHYEVLADSNAEEVKRRAEARAHAIEAVHKAPLAGIMDDYHMDEEPGIGDKVRAALIERLKGGLLQYWAEMLAIEEFLVEAAETFDGEDPAIPEVRAILDWMRPELEQLHATLRDLHRVDVALPGPNPERLTVIKKVARWPEARRGIAESIHTKPGEAPSDEVEDQPGHDPETAPDGCE
jgi:hypothetical protein